MLDIFVLEKSLGGNPFKTIGGKGGISYRDKKKDRAFELRENIFCELFDVDRSDPDNRFSGEVVSGLVELEGVFLKVFQRLWDADFASRVDKAPIPDKFSLFPIHISKNRGSEKGEKAKKASAHVEYFAPQERGLSISKSSDLGIILELFTLQLLIPRTGRR